MAVEKIEGWESIERAGGEILVSELAESESRQVWLLAGEDGSLTVGEQSQGELTLSVYEVKLHTHKVVLEPGAAEALAAVFNVRTESAPHAIRAIFGVKNRYLSDFMDVLDREGIPYAYVSNLDGVISYRPSERPA